jgi:hypothetical protein
MTISQFLLDILICPKCKGSLQINEDKTALFCQKCRLKYRIEDDIPVMLIDEAEALYAIT